MKNKDEQLIYHINKHYNELIFELNLIIYLYIWFKFALNNLFEVYE